MTSTDHNRSHIGTLSRSTAVLVLTLLLATVPSATWAGLAAAPSSPSSVELSWTAPGDDGSSGTAALYDIRYSTSTITEGNWASATQATGEPTPSVAGSSESFTVAGLDPSTTYYFAIKAADEVPNYSLLSNVVSATTGAETDAPDDIADLAFNSASQTAITIEWTATGDDGSTGTASLYDIRYSTSLITDLNWDAATQATGEQAPSAAGVGEVFTISGLTEGTTYYFAIKVADEVPNWSGLSNVLSASTLDETDAPNAVNDLVAQNATGTTVDLVWTAVGDDGSSGTASTYDIRYSTSPITAGNFNSATQVTGEPSPKAAGLQETFTVTGLSESVTYYFAIKVADEVPNWSGVSNSPSATTADATPPSSIGNLQVTIL